VVLASMLLMRERTFSTAGLILHAALVPLGHSIEVGTRAAPKALHPSAGEWRSGQSLSSPSGSAAIALDLQD
jgi:hypothetical protein